MFLSPYHQFTVLYVGDMPLCDPKVYYSCVFVYLKKFITENVASTCDCRRQCNKLTYKYVVTQSEFSNYMIDYVRKTYGVNVTNEGWRQDYAGLEVAFLLIPAVIKFNICVRKAESVSCRKW